jgi:hypothetical protein
MVPKMSVEPAADAEISQWLEERRAIAERLLPEPPADDTYTLSLASLIDIAVDLGYEAPDPNSYINDDVAIYQRWMTKSKEPRKDSGAGSYIQRDFHFTKFLEMISHLQ